MPLLDKQSVDRAWTPKMIEARVDETPPFDFWPYVDQIPKIDYQGFDCSEGRIDWSWRTEDGAFEHVHISSKEDDDVFMVVILDLKKQIVYGHYLLDLKREYGLR